MLYFQDFKMEEKNSVLLTDGLWINLFLEKQVFGLFAHVLQVRQALKKTAQNKILALPILFHWFKKAQKITTLWRIHLYSLLLRGKLPIADIFAKGHIKFSKTFFQKRGKSWSNKEENKNAKTETYTKDTRKIKRILTTTILKMAQ